MSWVALEDGFIRHPKIIALTDTDLRVWLRLLCWSAQYRTRGVVSEAVLGEVPGATRSRLDKFAGLGLLDRLDVGFVIHDWAEYNGNARERADARERKRLQRQREKETNGDADA